MFWKEYFEIKNKITHNLLKKTRFRQNIIGKMLNLDELQKIGTQIEPFWKNFTKYRSPKTEYIISAKKVYKLIKNTNNIREIKKILNKQNVIKDWKLKTNFKEGLGQEVRENHYYHDKIVEEDKKMFKMFQHTITQIIISNPLFIDQIRCLHFLSMVGHEDLMLIPAQTQRLKKEGVHKIAGEIRTIATGFGGKQFNAPKVEHLRPLLALYVKKVELMKKKVNGDNIYDFVSFAQYYFAILHPFYERCGRTSEELIYLLFEQTDKTKVRYISNTGWRESPLAKDREYRINKAATEFNKRIAISLNLDPNKIRRTPHIYKQITKKYFPEKYSEIYNIEREKEFYYNHPIPEIINMYYFAMESLLYDEISDFDIKNPYKHIKKLGNHLKNKGFKKYRPN